MKFPECAGSSNKDAVDQIVMLVDMKGAKLKDLSNKQLNVIFRALLIEIQHFYPELLNYCFLVNTPMFFLDFYESEIKPHISAQTQAKIVITGENSHKQILENFAVDCLPKLYGGSCDCEATCVYSDKGPWADVENKINFQNRYMTEMAGALGGPVEEYKFQEDEEDQIDLLSEKNGLDDLKNAIQRGNFGF